MTGRFLTIFIKNEGFHKKVHNFRCKGRRALKLGSVDRELIADSEYAIKIARILGDILKT